MLSSTRMGPGTRIAFVAAALLVTSTWLAARRAPQTPTQSDYAGSKACQACHPDAFSRWQASLHIQMTRPVAEATVLGDFSSGARLNAHGRSYGFGTRQGRPFVTVRAEGRAAETYRVDHTLGSKRFQGYLSTLPDGRMYVRARLHPGHEVVPHRVDRTGHRVRGVSRPG